MNNTGKVNTVVNVNIMLALMRQNKVNARDWLFFEKEKATGNTNDYETHNNDSVLDIDDGQNNNDTTNFDQDKEYTVIKQKVERGNKKNEMETKKGNRWMKEFQ